MKGKTSRTITFDTEFLEDIGDTNFSELVNELLIEHFNPSSKKNEIKRKIDGKKEEIKKIEKDMEELNKELIKFEKREQEIILKYKTFNEEELTYLKFRGKGGEERLEDGSQIHPLWTNCPEKGKQVSFENFKKEFNRSSYLYEDFDKLLTGFAHEEELRLKKEQEELIQWRKENIPKVQK